MLENCRKGYHELTEIYRAHRLDDYDEEHVVRWCKECGAVVVDADYDGRTYAGKIMKMKFPKIVKNK